MSTPWEPYEGEGWRQAEYDPPPRDEAVEFHSIWAVSPFFGRWNSLPWEFNVYGLYWRHI